MRQTFRGCIQVGVTVLGLCLFVAESADIACSTPGSSIQGSSCFLASRFYTTWTDAYSFCSSLGCALASPDNTVKISEIREYAKSVGLYTNMYLGATDANSEGVFVKAGSGSTLVALDWATGEPSGGAQQNCLMTDHVDGFKMYDTSCKEKRRFICDCPSQIASGLLDLV